MKDILVILAALAALAGNAKAAYRCESKATDQDVPKMNLNFDLHGLNGGIRISKVEGSMKECKNCYLLKFNVSGISNDKKYKPKKYINSIRFKLESVDQSAPGAVFGNLIVERETNSEGKVPVHYIYQGDQSGGTIHMTCDTE